MEKVTLESLIEEQQQNINNGIWHILAGCGDLSPRDGASDLAQDVMLWMCEEYDALAVLAESERGRRVRNHAIDAAREWKAQRIRERRSPEFTEERESMMLDAKAGYLPAGRRTNYEDHPTSGMVARRQALDVESLCRHLGHGPRGRADLERLTGLGRRRLDHAAKQLGVIKSPSTYAGEWLWSLPDRLKLIK